MRKAFGVAVEYQVDVALRPMADGLGLVLAGLAETEPLKQFGETGGRVLIHREFQEFDAETL